MRAYEYLQTYQPGRLKKTRTRNEWQLQDHDSFKINEITSKWHWKSRDIGGMSALRFLMQVDGMEYTEAVKALCEQTMVYVPREEPAPRKKPFSLPLPNDNFYRVRRYLNQRGIRDDVLDYCVQLGILYESTPYHNAVFVGMDEQGKAKYAFLRGIYDSRGKNFRMEQEGSEKQYSFCVPPLGKSCRVAVYEACIDALAHMTLEDGRTDKYRDWEEENSNDFEDEQVIFEGADLTEYASVIQEKIAEYSRVGHDDDKTDNLMDYFDGRAAIKEKVVSAVPSVKEADGVLYGCTTLELKEYLETEELSELCVYLTGQYSDGWGEGFEQQEIQVDGGEIYVHFWQPKDYLFEQAKPEAQKNQEPEKKRPKMQLLGREGNVFAILGAAAGLLIKEGMDQQANEMYERVMKSDHFYQALHIISEYVETELSVSDEKSQTRKSQLLECIQKNKKKSKKQPER